jgi:hypothetical protein
MSFNSERIFGIKLVLEIIYYAIIFAETAKADSKRQKPFAKCNSGWQNERERLVNGE